MTFLIIFSYILSIIFFFLLGIILGSGIYDNDFYKKVFNDYWYRRGIEHERIYINKFYELKLKTKDRIK